ncbi:MAG: CAP domain-containing protein, partial [Caldilineaceae bacterium]
MLPLLALLLALLLACMPRLATAQETLPDPAQQVLTLVNQTRANNGLAPLALNPLLVSAAQSHVDDMVANHLYSHTGSDGSSVRARAR